MTLFWFWPEIPILRFWPYKAKGANSQNQDFWPKSKKGHEIISNSNAFSFIFLGDFIKNRGKRGEHGFFWAWNHVIFNQILVNSDIKKFQIQKFFFLWFSTNMYPNDPHSKWLWSLKPVEPVRIFSNCLKTLT